MLDYSIRQIEEAGYIFKLYECPETSEVIVELDGSFYCDEDINECISHLVSGDNVLEKEQGESVESLLIDLWELNHVRDCVQRDGQLSKVH